jgi:predicted  nucleic acid-binding Zn-ribbon protein
MNKLKVRCTVCGKSFKTPSAKKTVCPSCDAEAKRAKHQHVPAVEQRPVDAVSTVDVRAVLRAGQENRGEFAAYKAPPAPTVETPTEPAAKQGAVKPAGRQGRSAHPERTARPAAGARAPRPPREPKPRVVQKPFEPSQEQIEAIRHRYMELAHPEFDGIRHTIATELGIPLRVVKQKVKELREEKAIASWWESGQMLPTPDQIELVRASYTPHLPEPAVGIHKEIAKELKLANTSVYLAIGQIRRDMDLPRYNARPDLTDHEVVGPDEPAEQELAQVGAGEATGTAARTHGGE